MAASQCMTRSIRVYRRIRSLMLCLVRNLFRSKAEIVEGDADEAADHGEVAEPFERSLPDADAPGDARIAGQAAVGFRVGGVVEDIDDAGAADTFGVVDAG